MFRGFEQRRCFEQFNSSAAAVKAQRASLSKMPILLESNLLKKYSSAIQFDLFVLEKSTCIIEKNEQKLSFCLKVETGDFPSFIPRCYLFVLFFEDCRFWTSSYVFALSVCGPNLTIKLSAVSPALLFSLYFPLACKQVLSLQKLALP